MKHFRNISMMLLLCSVVFVSCLTEDFPAPKVAGVKFYILNDKSKYEEVVNPQSGVKYTVAIESDADIIVFWPGAEREVMKDIAGNDSIDINGNQVLVKSNYYSDYGLLRAKGIKTSLNEEIGWNALYTYPEAGTFSMVVVGTNHGYDSGDYDQRTFPFDIVIKD